LMLIASEWGIDPSGRYLVPLYLPVVFICALFIDGAWKTKLPYGGALVIGILTINSIGIWIGATSPEKITTQFDPISSFDNSYDEQLLTFLDKHHLTRGYTNYFVAFRLIFVSGEKFIYSPEIPYKSTLSYTPLDNRYPLYGKLVDESDKVAYITTNHPVLDQVLRGEFDRLKVTFLEKSIGPYHIFYNLSRPVRPGEINNGTGAQ